MRKPARNAPPDREEPMQGVVLQPGGRLDMATYAEFECDVLAALEAGTLWLVFDFSEVFYLGTLAVRVVMTAMKRLRAAGGRLAICGMQMPVADVIEISGLTPLLEIYPDRATALAALS
jgi:anti-anti-sigma factor